MKLKEYLVYLVIFLLMIAGLIYAMDRALPSLERLESKVKYWDVYSPERDIYLWSLAQKCASSNKDPRTMIDLIKRKNPWIKEYLIKPGEKILIPVF